VAFSLSRVAKAARRVSQYPVGLVDKYQRLFQKLSLLVELLGAVSSSANIKIASPREKVKWLYLRERKSVPEKCQVAETTPLIDSSKREGTRIWQIEAFNHSAVSERD